MGRWAKGETTIEEFLASRELEAVVGAKADGQSWIEKARRTLESASELTDRDPDSACGLRRQRNELEYPAFGTESLSEDDANAGVAQASHLIDTAEQMLPHLGLFRTGQ